MAGRIAEAQMQWQALAAMKESTEQKINEAITDYTKEIERLQETKSARENAMENEIGRVREAGITALTERGAQAGYETRKAMMGAAQAASSAEARLGASGVRATGTALAGRQQDVDIAYAGAQRVAEAGAAQMKLGGLQLGSQLQGAQEKKSLLTMEYRQNITEQQRKLAELQANKGQYLGWVVQGGLAGIYSNFYQGAKQDVGSLLALLGTL